MKQIMIDSSIMSTLILILKKSIQILTIRNGRKKMIDVHAVNKTKKNKESIQILTIGKKKMIDVHTVNQKKVKKVHRFLQYERKKMIHVHTINQKK